MDSTLMFAEIALLSSLWYRLQMHADLGLPVEAVEHGIDCTDRVRLKRGGKAHIQGLQLYGPLFIWVLPPPLARPPAQSISSHILLFAFVESDAQDSPTPCSIMQTHRA